MEIEVKNVMAKRKSQEYKISTVWLMQGEGSTTLADLRRDGGVLVIPTELEMAANHFQNLYLI